VSPVVAQRCGRCGSVVFPARLLCPSCASRDWRGVPVAGGTVEELTRMAGDRVLAAVRLAEGGVAIARLEGRVETGSDVSLELVRGALVARRRAA